MTNTEQYMILSKPFVRQKDAQKVLGCSQSKVSKLMHEYEIIDRFGLGYSSNDIIKKFKIDFDRITEGMKIEREIAALRGPEIMEFKTG